MDTHDIDYALLSINAEETTYIAGPFEHALAVMKMLAHNIVNHESVTASVTVQANAESGRASLLIVVDTGNAHVVSMYMLLPVPRILNQDDLQHLTDLGMWEAEMTATPDNDDNT